MDNMGTLRRFVDIVSKDYEKPKIGKIVRVKGNCADIRILRNDGSFDDNYPEIPSCPYPSLLTDNGGIYFKPRMGLVCVVAFASGDLSKPYIVSIHGEQKSNDGEILILNGNSTVVVGKDSIAMNIGNNAIEADSNGVTIRTSTSTMRMDQIGVTIDALMLTINGALNVNGNILCTGTNPANHVH